jgi:nucleoredoxin
MALLNELFGVNNVRNKNGDIVDLIEQCTGKSIGIFFSANWCGACQYFTPVLAKFYRKYAKTKNIEILFVSSDENEQSFDKYYAEMPWLALDYNDRDRKVRL